MTNLNRHTYSLLQSLEQYLSDNSIDDLVLWVECSSYQQEIDKIEYEITTDSNNRKIGHIIFKFEEINQLNIPIDEIKDTVSDERGRTVGVHYNDGG